MTNDDEPRDVDERSINSHNVSLNDALSEFNCQKICVILQIHCHLAETL